MSRLRCLGWADMFTLLGGTFGSSISEVSNSLASYPHSKNNLYYRKFRKEKRERVVKQNPQSSYCVEITDVNILINIICPFTLLNMYIFIKMGSYCAYCFVTCFFHLTIYCKHVSQVIHSLLHHFCWFVILLYDWIIIYLIVHWTFWLLTSFYSYKHFNEPCVHPWLFLKFLEVELLRSRSSR